MDITFLGHSAFKLRGKKTSLVTDPYDSDYVGLKFPKTSADIVTISHNHKGHNKAGAVKDVRMVIDGPGEYEIAGVSIIGISTYHDNKKGESRDKNTVYVIEIDGLRVVHLGDLGHKLSESQLDMIGDVDVLMVPVGAEYTMTCSQAVEEVRKFEPKIILPMHYRMVGLKPELSKKLVSYKAFVGDLGLPVEKSQKLSVKKVSLGEEQKVVILAKK